MYSKIEARSLIKYFVISTDKTDAQIVNEITNHFKNEAPSRATIYRWILVFKRGECSLLDKRHRGSPVRSWLRSRFKDQKNIKKDRRVTVEELSVQLKVAEGTVCSICKRLELRKVCCRFVPKCFCAQD